MKKAKKGGRPRSSAKCPRTNIQLTDENYRYMHVMANMQSMNMTEFINLVLDRDREGHEDDYREAVKIEKQEKALAARKKALLQKQAPTQTKDPVDQEPSSKEN